MENTANYCSACMVRRDLVWDKSLCMMNLQSCCSSFLARHKNQSSTSKSSKKSPPSSSSPPPPPAQIPRPPSPLRAVKLEFMEQEIYKLEKFGKLLAGPNTDLGKSLIHMQIILRFAFLQTFTSSDGSFLNNVHCTIEPGNGTLIWPPYGLRWLALMIWSGTIKCIFFTRDC